MNVRVDGRLGYNDTRGTLAAATEGFGLAFVIQNRAQAEIAAGRLVRLFGDWCLTFPATTYTIRAGAKPPRPSS